MADNIPLCRVQVAYADFKRPDCAPRCHENQAFFSTGWWDPAAPHRSDACRLSV